MENNLFAVLTLFDSSFPTGAFARSNGYEAARQFGYVKDRASFCFFCRSALDNAIAQQIPVITKVYRIVKKSSLEAYESLESNFTVDIPQSSIRQRSSSELIGLDTLHDKTSPQTLPDSLIILDTIFTELLDLNELTDATLICNPFEYNASVSQGASLLLTLEHMATHHVTLGFGQTVDIARFIMHTWKALLDAYYDGDKMESVPPVQSICQQQSDQFLTSGKQGYQLMQTILMKRLCPQTPPHYSLLIALMCLSVGINLQQCCEAIAVTYIRSTVSAAVRDGLLGPLEGQNIIMEILGLWKKDYKLEKFNNFSVNDMIHHYRHHSFEASIKTNPLIDLLQSSHSLLFSKLFLS